MASSPWAPDDALKDNKTAYTLTSQEFALGNELFQRSSWPVGSFIVTSVVLGCTISLFLPGEPPGRLDMAIRCLTMSVAIFCGLLALMKFSRIRNRRRTATNYDLSPFGNMPCTVEWTKRACGSIPTADIKCIGGKSFAHGARTTVSSSSFSDLTSIWLSPNGLSRQI